MANIADMEMRFKEEKAQTRRRPTTRTVAEAAALREIDAIDQIVNDTVLSGFLTPAHPRQRTRDEAAALREIDAIDRRVSSQLAAFLAPDPD